MTTDIGVKKTGSRTTGTGLVIAAIGAILLIAGIVGSGSGSILSVLLIAAGLVVAGIGFARRILAAVESR
jgi:hypothetical protein